MKRLLILALVILASACGDAGDQTTTTLAGNCEELSQAGIDLLDGTLDAIDELDAAVVAESVPGLLEEFRQDNALLLAQQNELKCKPEEIDQYFCANVDQMAPVSDTSASLLAQIIQATC